jgi:hypothetical protein
MHKRTAALVGTLSLSLSLSLSPLAPAQTAPAPASAPAPAPAPAPASAPAPPFLQPDTGTPVEFDSTKPLISVYLAPGIVDDTTPRYPDPFFKIGRTPITVKIAPGTYTVNVESPDTTVGNTVVRVGAQPVHVRIRAGSDDMCGLGTLLFAGGAAAVLAAVVLELSYSPAPNGISKSKIAVPLFAVGGAGVAGGLTFYLLSGTSFEQDGLAPDRRGMSFGVRSVW